ncbi:phosphate ABC transporter permease subunit PstC [Natronobacterium gregoryi]|uniref:Phosphate transport system permease protein n=2 Tax=Natronobacterium gregoryi TaxID=44930 RepID=L0ACJ8_NATGS|nr:phosphate ABC transporter permease subunit PstC [Natronobacterium gregoryi]AFZ71608.1 phosphate ABC transporter, permease protein PstC [Natronobacterium gregoryi SP2]ELY66663.1 phosphate ABC transporter permease [Natronobacterium gregoryi SP2]PLK21375.1 phosphate ABC transporter permease subunit PstC [Natronobacterium gregoryi SP2]SFI80602.1 phosphate ABC transporter membrane protein 1, PhoT family [Natronobacterium gregoryi]
MSTEPLDLSRDGNDVGTLGDKLARYVFFACAFVTVATTLAIIVVLVDGAIDFFAHVSFTEYFTGTNWSPRAANEPSFGVLPLIWGTLMITIGSALIAIPVGTLTAIYLAEYADPRVRQIVKPTLEILAGIPTIVYGFFALSFITPILQQFYPETGTFNAAAGAIVVGIMILPMVSSISEDAMSAVPDSLRNAAYGLGATKFEVSTNVVLPASLSGILAAYILAISRAIGETMAVTLAAGALPQITRNPLEEVQTMTAYMVEIGTGDASVGSIGYQSLFAIGLTLFVMTFLMNVFSMWVRSRYREEYQ